MATGDRSATTSRTGRVEQPIRAAELVGALSLATDLGTGQPLEHALRTAVLAVRLGELAGASPPELTDTYYVALLHASGCTSNSHEAAQLFGDDIAHRAAFFLIDPADPAQVLGFYRDYVGAVDTIGIRGRECRVAALDHHPGDPLAGVERYAHKRKSNIENRCRRGRQLRSVGSIHADEAAVAAGSRVDI